MARTRSIKPGFFKNEDLAECCPLARLLFAGLWTLADRLGRLEYRPKRIKAELFPYDDCDVAKMLEDLQRHGFLQVYQADEKQYIAISKFEQHQNPHPSEKPADYPDPPENLNKNVRTIKNNCEQLKNISENAFHPSTLLPSTPSPCKPKPTSVEVASASRKKHSIGWDSEKGFTGIDEQATQEFQKAFPAVNVDQELLRAHLWLKSNPTKSKRSQWRRFVTNWFSRVQDRGGSKSHQPAPTPTSCRKFFRSEFQENLTDKEYQQKKNNKTTLPDTLKLKKVN